MELSFTHSSNLQGVSNTQVLCTSPPHTLAPAPCPPHHSTHSSPSIAPFAVSAAAPPLTHTHTHARKYLTVGVTGALSTGGHSGLCCTKC